MPDLLKGVRTARETKKINNYKSDESGKSAIMLTDLAQGR
jgi:hypothetical protein